jgi:hypothetical protein
MIHQRQIHCKVRIAMFFKSLQPSKETCCLQTREQGYYYCYSYYYYYFIIIIYFNLQMGFFPVAVVIQ